MHRALATTLAVALAACSSTPSSEPPLAPEPMPGRFLDGPDSAALGAEGNQVTCYTCHSGDGASYGFAGPTFRNVAYRSPLMSGMAPSLRDAVNGCITMLMAGKPLQENDERYRSIARYLMSKSASDVTSPYDSQFEALPDLESYAAAYQGGDAEAGRRPFLKYCALCHDRELIVGKTSAPSVADLRKLPLARIAQKVRQSGKTASPDSAPTTNGTAAHGDNMAMGEMEHEGMMPPFGLTALSRQDLKNLLAYLAGPESLP